MKALSLWQPWATLIAIGAKKVETRSWKTDYRGPLAIHAAKGWTEEVVKMTMRSEPFRSVLTAAGYPLFSLLPRGVVVATCRLESCKIIERNAKGWGIMGNQAWPLDDQERAFGDYTPGRYAWLLADVVKLAEPMPARGAQGLFEWPGAQ